MMWLLVWLLRERSLRGKEQRGAGVRGENTASRVNLCDGEGNVDSRMVLSGLNDRPYVCKID